MRAAGEAIVSCAMSPSRGPDVWLPSHAYGLFGRFGRLVDAALSSVS